MERTEESLKIELQGNSVFFFLNFHQMLFRVMHVGYGWIYIVQRLCLRGYGPRQSRGP